MRRSANTDPQPLRTVNTPEAETPRPQAEQQAQPEQAAQPEQPEQAADEPRPGGRGPRRRPTPHAAPRKAPRKALRSPARPRRARRPWAKAKALAATFAIGVLIVGAALPALSPVTGPVAAATTVGVAADGAAQSYTSTDEIRAEIAPRGSFSATTPEEVKETRSRAAAAAVAAGMPLGSAIEIPVADRVVMPMADGTYSFTDGFGASRPGRSHLGQDFAAGVGTPINAAMKGCVSRSTESYQGYGVTIQIESIVDGQAVSTVYSHMNYGTRAVEVGDCVDEGQYIGDVGSTGYVFGSCLHFEVHISMVPVDPLPWLRTHVS